MICVGFGRFWETQTPGWGDMDMFTFQINISQKYKAKFTCIFMDVGVESIGGGKISMELKTDGLK
jgi:hypothetical protein